MVSETSTSFQALNPRRAYVLGKRTKWLRRKRKSRENFVRPRVSKSDLVSLKYLQFLPLYRLWCDYFSILVGSCGGRPDARLLRADYHGCLLMVTEADNPSQVGCCGILVRETRHTFMLINVHNKLLTIPKRNSVFQFALKGKIYTLFGNAFRFQPSIRAKKILRNRIPIHFFLR